MAKPFKNLVNKMSTESRERAHQKADILLKEIKDKLKKEDLRDREPVKLIIEVINNLIKSEEDKG